MATTVPNQLAKSLRSMQKQLETMAKDAQRLADGLEAKPPADKDAADPKGPGGVAAPTGAGPKGPGGVAAPAGAGPRGPGGVAAGPLHKKRKGQTKPKA